VFLIILVDDMLLSGSNGDASSMVKLWLISIFDMKDLGKASYILGITLHLRCNRMLGLSHASYIDKILEHFSMENSKKRFLLFRDGVTLSRFMCSRTQEERENMRWIPYASAIRKSHVCHTVNATRYLLCLWHS
jgi:hypothetical protein